MRFLQDVAKWFRDRAFNLFVWVVTRATAVVAFVFFRLLTLRERYRPRPAKPRLFWGTIPMFNMKYHSLAMRRLGYESTTVVDDIYAIHSRDDYDVLASELVERLPLMEHMPRLVRRLLEPYVTFTWALRNYDVFTIYTSGRILRKTPLRYRELQLLHRARKKVVLLPYGADVQVMSR